ncbi:MAG: hypothetical protein LBK66_08820 [Spirochaetaceae bacterium]|nr:hypothetical protein [Spirochaetaceae bacterium]
MKKIYSVSIFVIICLILFSTCFSGPQAKPLDLTSITEPLPISSINLFIRKDIDENEKGREFIRSFYTENISIIKEMLIDKGININDELFLENFDNNSNIEFQEIKITPTFIVHRYYWNSEAQFETHLEFLLNFIIQEDGTMPLEATIKKDDPEYEPGYATTITLHLKFE